MSHRNLTPPSLDPNIVSRPETEKKGFTGRLKRNSKAVSNIEKESDLGVAYTDLA